VTRPTRSLRPVRRPLSIRLGTLAAGVLLACAAHAQSPTLALDLPARPLDQALSDLARQAGVQVLFTSSLAQGKTAPALKGSYTAREALERVLAGSGLVLRAHDDKTFTVEPAPPSQESAVLSEVVVSATRTEAAVDEVPAAVTVIRREELQRQLAAQPNLTDALGKLVPGLAPGSQSLSTYGQTLRGRGVAVLIDGVPQNPVRNGSRNLTVIDPSAIERIEVIRGASAAYGNGGTGGIINIITRRAGDKPEFTTEVGTSFSLTHPVDSLGLRLAQTASGRKGMFDYIVSAAVERTGGYFDAEGDRIPPDPFGQGGMADSRNWNVFAKAGMEPDRDQRVELSFERFDSEQHSDHANDPAVNAEPPLTTKARARSGLELDERPESENTVVNLEYRHRDLPVGELRAQAFYRDYLTRYSPFDGRSAVGGIAQSFILSENQGARVELSSHLGGGTQLLWGIDVTHEETQQRVTYFDTDAWLASGGLVYNKTGERGWVPLIKLDQQAFFAQLEVPLGERWLVRGGARREVAEARVDDFVTVRGNLLRGGTARYAETVYNLGAVYTPNDAINFYGNFSQGYSVPDFGLVFRYAPNNSSVDSLDLQPQKVDAVEFGTRWQTGGWRGSAAVFYNESEFGTTSGGLGRPPVRAPERVWGVEATLDAQLAAAWSAGGTLTWVEGVNEPNRDGDWDRLNNFRIPPLKLTAYVEHRTSPDWTNRLQALYSGNRDHFGNDTRFGFREVESYATLDWLSELRVTKDALLRFGIDNVLNAQYYPRESQLLWSGNNSSYSAARGAVAHASYVVKW